MGARIKRARLKQNLTQEQLAELLDISVSYVSLIVKRSFTIKFGSSLFKGLQGGGTASHGLILANIFLKNSVLA